MTGEKDGAGAPMRKLNESFPARASSRLGAPAYFQHGPAGGIHQSDSRFYLRWLIGQTERLIRIQRPGPLCHFGGARIAPCCSDAFAIT